MNQSTEHIKLLVHFHSSASYDSSTTPTQIVDFCVHHAIDWLALTDHDSFDNLAELNQLAQSRGIVSIPACEFDTSAGDVIGLFIDSRPPSKNVNEVIDFIHSNNGLVLLPHPYRGHSLEQIPVDKIDLIEIHNSRLKPAENQQARKLAAKHDKPVLVGPDAHLASELGLAINTLELKAAGPHSTDQQKQIILKAKRQFKTDYTNERSIHISQLIKARKKRRPKLFVKQLAWLTAPWLMRKLKARLQNSKSTR